MPAEILKNSLACTFSIPVAKLPLVEVVAAEASGKRPCARPPARRLPGRSANYRCPAAAIRVFSSTGSWRPIWPKHWNWSAKVCGHWPRSIAAAVGFWHADGPHRADRFGRHRCGSACRRNSVTGRRPTRFAGTAEKARCRPSRTVKADTVFIRYDKGKPVKPASRWQMSSPTGNMRERLMLSLSMRPPSAWLMMSSKTRNSWMPVLSSEPVSHRFAADRCNYAAISAVSMTICERLKRSRV